MNTSASYISDAAKFSPGAPLVLVVQMMLNPIKHRPKPTVRHLLSNTESGDLDDPKDDFVTPVKRPWLVERFNRRALERYAPMRGKGPMRPADVAKLIGIRHDDAQKQLFGMARKGIVAMTRGPNRSRFYEWIEE